MEEKPSWTREWDKTFPRSEKVEHRKVAFHNRYGITLAATIYDISRVNVKGYFNAEDSAETRHEKRKALCAQRTGDYRNGAYVLGGGMVDPLPEDAPFFVKDTTRPGAVHTGRYDQTDKIPFDKLEAFFREYLK